jgi:hypothetical protein
MEEEEVMVAVVPVLEVVAVDLDQVVAMQHLLLDNY